MKDLNMRDDEKNKLFTVILCLNEKGNSGDLINTFPCSKKYCLQSIILTSFLN